MRLLLDTHFVIWVSVDPLKVPKKAVELLEAPQADLWFSVASLWEIAIKTGLGRAGFQVDVQELRRSLLDNGYRELNITSDHAIAVADLPHIHGDPFDRLLVVQAAIEGLELLTADRTIARYPGPIRLV